MFGFARSEFTASYRSVYSRLCQYQHGLYGKRSALFHSYDAIFLFACAKDAAMFNSECIKNQTCCRLRSLDKDDSKEDQIVAEYCTSFAMLLTWVKLQDDVIDGKLLVKQRANFLLWLFRNQIEKMKSYFNKQLPGFLENLNTLVNEHHCLEKQDPSSHAIDSYVVPTAKAFQSVFVSLCKLLNNHQSESTFSKIGYDFGASLIAFDCGVDWKKDLKNGDYNIVKDEQSAREMLDFSISRLNGVSELCRNQFGLESISGKIAKSISERITTRLLDREEVSSKTISQSLYLRTRRILSAFSFLIRAVIFTIPAQKRAKGYLFIDPCCALTCQHCFCRVGEKAGEAACEGCMQESGANSCCDDCTKDCEKDCC